MRKSIWALGIAIIGAAILYMSMGSALTNDVSEAQPSPEFQAAAPVNVSDSPSLILPDLQVGAMRDIFITRNPESGEREIRFDTTVMNTGEGALELRGAYDEASDQVRVTQHLFTRDNDVEERLAGSFVYHEGHNHWHFEHFNLFELFTHHEDGSLDQLVAATDKMSFCLYDEDWIDPPLPNAPAVGVYPWCDDNEEIQGMSAGWSDTYTSNVEGQQINIEDVPDGRYAIKATIDPQSNILELNKDNNSSIMYVEIRNLDIQVVPVG